MVEQRHTQDLADALASMIRIVEAMRVTNLLGKSQTERLEKAKAVLARATSPSGDRDQDRGRA